MSKSPILALLILAVGLAAGGAEAQQQRKPAAKPPAGKPPAAAAQQPDEEAGPGRRGPIEKPGEAVTVLNAQGFPTVETPAQFAFMMDAKTGTVLLDKNADQRMAPSSMSKMMTAHMVFEKLKKGELKMEDEFTVSENAWRKQGSKMFVDLNSRVTVRDLLKGIIIQSGNDACIVMAEGLSGSEEAFADLMNAKGKEMGLTGTHFHNATGWPDPDHYTTPRDLAKIALDTINTYPEFYPIYAEKEFMWHGIKQGNRNPLLYVNMGADGLKTGHTEGAGYGLTGSAVRDGRRLILVLNGMTSMRMRQSESIRLMDWGFREFENYQLFKPGDVVEQAPVWLGASKTVPLVAGDALQATLPRRARKDMTVTVSYNAPLPAPLKKGDLVGKLKVTAPGVAAIELPLVAGADVPELGMFGRVGAAFSYLVFGAGKA